MSDLDNDLRGLREELTAAIPLPDLDRVTGRARTRRRLQVAAIAVVVAVVAVAVPLARATKPTPPATNTPPKAHDTSYVLDFADPKHGYALARRCTPGASSCAFTLLRTADGGRTWGKRQLPPAQDPKTGYFSATMYVLGPDAITIDRPNPGYPDRIHSTDGGRSWHTVYEATVGRTSGPLPKGALLTARCDEQPFRRDAHCSDLGSIDPATGQFVLLPEQPPLNVEQIGPTPTGGGRYWAIGRTLSTDRYAIAITSDGGLTWSVSRLDDGSTANPGDWSVVENGDAMYVFSRRDLWRSTDGGESWTYASTTGGPLPVLVVGSPVAAADGSLLLSDAMSTWESTDRGQTFTRIDMPPFGVKWTRGGYLWLKFDHYALSSDGLNWRDFTIE